MYLGIAHLAHMTPRRRYVTCSDLCAACMAFSGCLDLAGVLSGIAHNAHWPRHAGARHLRRVH